MLTSFSLLTFLSRSCTCLSTSLLFRSIFAKKIYSYVHHTTQRTQIGHLTIYYSEYGGTACGAIQKRLPSCGHELFRCCQVVFKSIELLFPPFESIQILLLPDCLNVHKSFCARFLFLIFFFFHYIISHFSITKFFLLIWKMGYFLRKRLV